MLRIPRRLVCAPMLLLAALRVADAATFHYSIPGPGPQSASGTHLISFPATLPGVSNCTQLTPLIPNLVNVTRYNTSTDSFTICGGPCPSTQCFPIVPGVGYMVKVSGAGSTFQLEGTDASTVLQLGGPGTSSASGIHLISVPFGTPLTNAADLQRSLGGAGVVTSVARLLTLTDTFETFPSSNFALQQGQAYQITLSGNILGVVPSFGGNFCDSSTTCSFSGYRHVTSPGSGATMTINANGELLVSNLGTSGNDCVDIEGPGVLPPPPPTSHEDWIPLGVSTSRPVSGAGTGVSAQINTRSTTQLSTAFGPDPPELITSHVEDTGPGAIHIATDFSSTVSPTIGYKVLNAGTPVPGATSAGQALSSQAIATDWPVRRAYSAYQWDAPVQIQIPGQAGSFTGNELWIYPDNDGGQEPLEVEEQRLCVRCGVDVATCTSFPGLTSLTLAEVLYPQIASGQPLPPLPGPPGPPLSTSRSGSGAGTVTSSPPGINCGSACTARFPSGSIVALTPTPAATSNFIAWAGDADCSDGSVTLSSFRTCTARFDVGPALTVTRAGSGSGSVSSLPAGISCGATCSATFTTGTVVSLSPSPSAGSVFAGWSGDADCADGSVTMSAARNCTATFTLAFLLSVAKTGSGSGTVTSSPAGINCGATCSASYASGTVVSLTPSAAGSSVFAGWSGDADCADGSVTMSAARSCTATFNLQNPVLSVGKTGTGSGTVTSSPPGINCGSTCSASYASGTVVNLNAAAAGGSFFAGWSGAPDCTDGVVTVNVNTSCTARFEISTAHAYIAAPGLGPIGRGITAFLLLGLVGYAARRRWGS